MRVFLSWCGADREIKDRVVEALRNTISPEDEVWESDLGCVSDFSADCIGALSESSVFLIIISDDTMRSSYAINELIKARELESEGKLNLVVYKITASPYTNQFVMQLNHISDANFVSRIKGDDTGAAIAASKVSRLLEMRRNGKPEKPLDVDIPKLNGINIGSAGYFVDGSRDEVFEKIKSGFDSSNVLFLSHINGFGRKTVLRKYVELHKNEFDQVTVIHSFKGDLKDLFIYGLEITNLNDEAYEQMNDEQIILRKLELLDKLGGRNMIVVPNLVMSDSVPTYILDALENVKFKIAFITPSASQKIRDRFCCVDVGRMSEEALDEIFFHYYDRGDQHNKQSLRDELHNFYNYIGGHTQSVELASNAMQNEIGLYPEDIPEILRKWMSREDDEYTGHITHVLSEIMDFSSFTEEEKVILCFASICAQLPMDEREFSDLLHYAEKFDPDAIRRLAGDGWIEHDRKHKTITVQPFVADTFLRNNSPDGEIVGSILSFYFEAFISSAAEMAVDTSAKVSKRIRDIFSALKLTYSLEVQNRYIKVMIVPDEITKQDEINFSGISLRAKGEISNAVASSPERDEINELAEVYFFILSTTYHHASMVFDVSRRTSDQSTSDMMFKTTFEENLNDYLQYIKEENHEIMKLMNELFGEGILTPKTALEGFMRFGERIDQIDINTEQGDAMIQMMLFMGYMLITLLYGYSAESNNYLLLELCRKFNDLYNRCPILENQEAVSAVYRIYYNSLDKLSIYTKETEEVFTSWAGYYLETASDDNSREEIIDVILTSAANYTVSLAKHVGPEEAEQFYRKYINSEQVLNSPKLTMTMLRAGKEISKAYIKVGKATKAEAFIREILSNVTRGVPIREGSEEESDYNEMSSLLSFFEQKDDDDFTEGGHLNYYKSYPKSIANKRKAASYLAVAMKCSRYDFSSLSDAELTDRALSLRNESATRKASDLYPEAFALASEAGMRTLGYKHHKVQYIGAAAMLDGNIAQILNGEGKTYTIILAAFVHTLYGRQVHILDKSTYLTERNYNWMKETLELLGLKVGLLTNSHLNVFEAITLSKCDVIYEASHAAIFYRLFYDFIPVFPKLRYDVVIVDEADLLMVEHGAADSIATKNDKKKKFLISQQTLYEMISDLDPEDDTYFKIDRDKNITLKEPLFDLLEAYCDISVIQTAMSEEDLESRMIVCVNCLYILEQDKDYFIVDDKIMFENNTTGEFYPASGYFDFFLKRKHGIFAIESNINHSVTGMMSNDEYILDFKFICGATATAISMQKEFKELFGLDVIEIAPNRPVIRKDHIPLVFLSRQAKLNAAISLAADISESGQPILIVTGSIEDSETISRELDKLGIKHVLLNAKNADDRPELLCEAGKLGRVTVSTCLANRGVDIVPGGDPRRMAAEHLLKNGANRKLLNSSIYSVNPKTPIERELREDYKRLLSMYKAETNDERESVRKLGGLCVIGTECFDDLRTEQQLIGRSGRQGFPGESYMLYSIEDSFTVRIGMHNYKRIYIERFKLDEDSYFESKFLDKNLANSRQKLQFALRRGLLESNYILYYRENRRTLLKILEDLKNGTLSVRDFVKKYYAGSESIQNYLLQRLEKGEPTNCFILRFITEMRNIEINKNNIASLIMSVYDSIEKEIPDSALTNPLRTLNVTTLQGIALSKLSEAFRNSLGMYYTNIKSEVKSAQTRFPDNPKKQKEFVTKSNRAYTARIIENGADQFLMYIANELWKRK